MQIDLDLQLNLRSGLPPSQEQPEPVQYSVQTPVQKGAQTPKMEQQRVPIQEPQLKQPQITKTVVINVEHKTPVEIMQKDPVEIMQKDQVEKIEKQPIRSMHKKHTKSPSRKLMTTTYRKGVIPSIHNSNDLILVYLMYKQQKLSLFLNKGVPFEYLTRKMYKQIYIYEKQTYSISNAILKNLLYKITGFQTIDNDIIYDYNFKYKRGTLEEQKFFLPFKQQDHKTPFKFYARISTNSYGGNQFLARNYSDGEWIVVSTIKKSTFDQEKINLIKKSLKTNSVATSLLLKNSSNFSQINWLQTKHYLIIVSEYFTQTLQENLSKNHSFYNQYKCQQIFVYYVRWLAFTLKQIVSSNIQNFKKINIQNIVLCPSDGQPKISVSDNVIHCIDFTQKRRSLISNGKRLSEKIHDSFYFETYLSLVKSLRNHLKRGQKTQKMFNQFIDFIEERNNSAEFTFDQAYKYFAPQQLNISISSLQKPKNKHPLKIDFSSRLSEIVSKNMTAKASSSTHDQETLLISDIKDEIQKLFCMENMIKNQQRNQAKSIVQMVCRSSSFGDIKKQNFGNVSEFKKEEERKYNLKKKQRMFIQDILNELNENENFIKTTKENNVASIEFYLKKSGENVKRKLRRATNFEDDAFNSKPSQECFFEEIDKQIGEDGLGKNSMLPNFGRSRKNILADEHSIKEQNHIEVVNSLLDKENFASQILSRLERKSHFGKSLNMTVGNSCSQEYHKKSNKLEELFIHRKNYSKEEKLALKKKQYGIYLDEAEKQLSKLRLYKKPKTNNSLKMNLDK